MFEEDEFEDEEDEEDEFDRSEKIRRMAEAFSIVSILSLIIGGVALAIEIFADAAEAGTICVAALSAAAWLFLVAQIIHIRANTEK